MVSSFEKFKRQQEENASQNSSNMLGIKPQSWNIYVKQNAQQGTTSINVNLRNMPNATKDHEIIDVDSFQFVVLTAMQIATANANNMGFARVTSNVTNKGYFNVRGVDEDNTSHPLGLYRGRNLRDAKAWSQLRLFGILRAVNGEGPAKNEVLNQYFDNQPLPVIMDLTFDKQNLLMDTIKANRYDFEALVGQSITITAGKNEDNTVKRHRQTLYLPNLEVTKLTDDQEEKMDAYAKDPINELLAFNEAVNKQDELYKKVYDAGITGQEGGQLLARLNEAGVTADNLSQYVAEQGGWANIGGQSEAPSVTPTAAPQTSQPEMPSPAPAPAPAADESTESTDDDDANTNLADDELPF